MFPARKQAVPSIERFFQFSLLGLIASAFCALADTGRLDLPSLVFLLGGVGLRALMVLGIVRLRIPPRLITVLATAYLLFYPIDYYFVSHNFFAATAHGVCFLGVARILSAQSNRDYLYTGSLAFVALMGAAALSTQIRFFLWLTLAIVFGLGVLTSAEIRRGFQSGARRVPTAGSQPVGGTGLRLALLVAGSACGILVLTVGLFFIVPRTARVAAMLLPDGPRLSGFSDSFDLGGFGPIAKDDRPVLHVHSYGRQLPPNLKWRGTTLSRFDGLRWDEGPVTNHIARVQGTTVVADLAQRSRHDGERVVYRVDVASSDTGTLFIAGVPEFINVAAPTLVQTPEDSFLALPAQGQPLGYEISAEMGAPLPSGLSGPERARNLELPRKLDRRIPQLGRAWTAGGDQSDMARAERISDHLHRDFAYSLDTGMRSFDHDPLATFLFVTKRGYCEYFASAMAVLLRTQGIPARVATGFQSGYYNDVSGSWVLRASDAHAWVEGWIEGRGWVTFDPTPPGDSLTAGGWLETKLRRMKMYLDAADTTWQRWVLAYDPGQQAALAFGVRNKLRSVMEGDSGFTWPDRMVPGARSFLLFGIVVLAGIFAFRTRWRELWNKWDTRSRLRRIRRGGGSPHDARLLYERMLETMARRGYQKPAWFTPGEFARNLPAGERERIGTFTATYYEVRFGGDPAGVARLSRMLESLESAK